MCKIIAIANQKGGVAKTTTTINLGVGLSKVGKRVMLIDADPQGHLTMGLGFPKNLRVTLKTMMENIIMGLEFDPREAILHHEEGIDVIPSNKLLSGMDMSLFTVEDREKVLKEYLELLENDYDYILIDCMPSLGMMTINALSAADAEMGKRLNFRSARSDRDRKNMEVAAKRWIKKKHPTFDGDVYVENIRCFLDISQEELEKRKCTVNEQDTTALIFSQKHLEALYLQCLMHRRNAMQEIPELKGLSETCNRIYKLQDVDVLFQCLLMDQMDWEEEKLYVQFSTIYLLKQTVKN